MKKSTRSQAEVAKEIYERVKFLDEVIPSNLKPAFSRLIKDTEELYKSFPLPTEKTKKIIDSMGPVEYVYEANAEFTTEELLDKIRRHRKLAPYNDMKNRKLVPASGKKK